MLENEYKKDKLALLDRVAVFITNVVGTVWCAVAFALLALISLPEAINGGASSIVEWTTQTFLQLVLLSIILVGQNIQTTRSELKSERDLETDLAIKNELEILIKRIDMIEADETKKIDKILKLLEEKAK